MIRVNWSVVRYRLCNLIPVKIRNYAAEKIANLLPRRVVGWVLFRACSDYGYNKHITLYAACAKYTKNPDGKRGAK